MPSRVLTGINLGNIENLRLQAKVGPFFALLTGTHTPPTPERCNNKASRDRDPALWHHREKMFFTPLLAAPARVGPMND